MQLVLALGGGAAPFDSKVRHPAYHPRLIAEVVCSLGARTSRKNRSPRCSTRQLDAMNRAKKVGVSVAGVLGFALMVATFVLSCGYFDNGLFEVKQTDWSQSGQVAMLAERSDPKALRSDEYFVLVGDHVFSPTELRDAFYGRREVFNAASDCLSVRWNTPSNLTVSCRDGSLDASHINLERRQTGDITITYVNIPDIAGGRP